MARTRYIKPEFFDSEKVASLSLAARLLFVGLWTLADRDGRFEMSPRRIRARLFPYDDAVDVTGLLNELIGRKMLQPYSAPDGTALGFLPGFPKHQRPHPNEAKSVLPPCPAEAVFAPLVTNVTSPNDACVQPSASTLTGTITGTLTSNGDGDQPPQSTASGGGVIVSAIDYEKAKRHNAYIGARLRIPHKLHNDFVAALGGESPDTTLRAWYATVDEEIERTREAIVPDVWKFMERRFKAWATTQATDAEWAAFDAKYGKGA